MSVTIERSMTHLILMYLDFLPLIAIRDVKK
jgi:hypothetical protein